MRKWFCFFKAYGDLIIASHFLRAQPKECIGVIGGGHLQPLSDAIGLSVSAKYINVDDLSVPAIFDLKRRGICAAMLSALRIRRALHREIDRTDGLVFDELTKRARYMAWPYRVEGVRSGESNIYLDYAKYFRTSPRMARKRSPGHWRSIAIFPDSRRDEKRMGRALLSRVVGTCLSRSIDPVVVCAGPQPSYGFENICDTRVIDRFDALVRAIRSCDAIVSTDSLPAHMAEYYGVPVFVLTPRRNDYWMPYSVFSSRSCALFDDIRPLEEWLSR